MSDNKQKKGEIIKWLKEFKRLSTSRISGLLGMNYDSTKIILEELKKEEKIIEQKETNASYWVLNNKIGDKANG